MRTITGIDLNYERYLGRREAHERGGFFRGIPQAGVRVDTTTGPIMALIDSEQSCCEEWGYSATVTTSDHKPDDFIGAVVIGLTTTDVTGRVQHPHPQKYLEEGDYMFVTIHTDRGDLQLTVYNAHNGYYGHSAIIIDGDETLKDRVL